SDDDREQIRATVQDVQAFENKRDILQLKGDHDRAVALLRLVRDKDFYNGKGEVVWRMEVWYFKNEAGGWSAVGQQQKVLRRERFKTADAYKAATESIRWLPELGGIRIGKDEPKRTVNVLTPPPTRPAVG